jgi:hypothetical protein
LLCVTTRKFEKHPLLGTRETTITCCLDFIATLGKRRTLGARPRLAQSLHEFRSHKTEGFSNSKA